MVWGSVAAYAWQAYHLTAVLRSAELQVLSLSLKPRSWSRAGQAARDGALFPKPEA